MILRVGLLLLVLNFVRNTDGFNNAIVGRVYRPSSIYGDKLLHLRKREANKPGSVDKSNLNANEPVDLLSNQNANISDVKLTAGLTEGGIVNSNDLQNDEAKDKSQQATGPVNPEQIINKQPQVSNDNKNTGTVTTTTELPKVNTTTKPSEIITTKTVVNETAISNSTKAENLLQSPGVVKRGLIVFGGFALLAVAYFVFYRRKGKNYDANNIHNNSDTNQFRYGVLQSDDRRDNLGLSRIPLTMESDEDDEDDLEIFDLEQKRKSLSYVNLQTNDEDIVLHSSKDESKNNLLLDIEDGPSDTLINWSNNGNKSIL